MPDRRPHITAITQLIGQNMLEISLTLVPAPSGEVYRIIVGFFYPVREDGTLN
ncbi:MAG: hypothetical protein ACE5R6_12010 [Candidatus Heimdallarchaeota archaeon]